jgi:hypothetical protein
MLPQPLFCPLQNCTNRSKAFEKIDDVRIHVNEEHAAILMFTDLPCGTRVVTKQHHENQQMIDAIQLHFDNCIHCPQNWKQRTNHNSRVTCPFSALNGPEKCRTMFLARRKMCEHLVYLPNARDENHGQMRKSYICPACEFRCDWLYGSGDDADAFWKHVLIVHGGAV